MEKTKEIKIFRKIIIIYSYFTSLVQRIEKQNKKSAVFICPIIVGLISFNPQNDEDIKK